MELTPKEKAKEIFEKFYSHKWQKHTSTRNYKIESMTKSSAKWCSNQLVNEILKSVSYVVWENEDSINFKPFFDYFEKVKQEIEKL